MQNITICQLDVKIKELTADEYKGINGGADLTTLLVNTGVNFFNGEVKQHDAVFNTSYQAAYKEFTQQDGLDNVAGV
jgi:hypothetical protein